MWRKLTLMKVVDVEDRKEKGRHERKPIEAVMLLKKFKHDELVKFCVMIPSKAWGKGVGIVGGLEGMVGKTWDATGTDDEVVDVDEAEDGEETDTVVWGFGSLFHLDWWESSPYHEGGEKTGADFRTRLAGKPPYTVNAITMNGTKTTAHKNRLPVRRFVSSEFRESQNFSKL